eukprot:snap_masked-scaffold_5-processed-gene-20.60-mRNA-1 protein AED:1.00 eAED:1.00 QI:0/0/0/0/1/1/2/0/944
MPLEEFSWIKAHSLTQGLQLISSGELAVSFVDVLLGRRGALELSKALSSHTSDSLVALNLVKTHIDGVGVEPLTRTLCDNRKLTYLSLSNNDLSSDPRGIRALGFFLKNNHTLKVLDLDQTNLKDNLKPISLGLKENRGLKTLSLNENSTSHKGLEILCSSLKKNKYLKELFLYDYENEFKDKRLKGVAKIIEVLKQYNTTLTCLAINCSDITLSRKLDEIMNRNLKISKMKKHEQMNIFKTTLQSKDKGPWMRSKLIFVGPERSGKTSLINALIGKSVETKGSKGVINIRQVQTKPLGKSATSSWKETALREATDRGLKFSSFNHAAVLASRIAIEKRKDMLRKRRTNNKFNEVTELKRFGLLNLKPHGHDPAQIKALVRSATQMTQGSNASGLNKDQLSSFKHKYMMNRMKKTGTTLTQLSAESITQLEEMVRKMSSVSSLLKRKGSEEGKVWNYLDQARKENSHKVRPSINYLIYDFCGRERYHILQNLFLTDQGAVYLVVFNFAQMLSNKKVRSCLRSIKQWIKSIYLKAPRASIILIGTNNSLRTTESTLQGINNHLLDTINELSIMQELNIVKNDDLIFFSVDSKTGAGVSEIRYTIEKTTLEQEYIYQQVPMNYLRCLDALLSTGKGYMNMEELIELSSSSEIDVPESQVEQMLSLFHQLGIILFFPHLQKLRDRVILSPEWLVDEFSKLLINGLDSGNKFKIVKLKVELRDLRLLEDNEKLFQNGIVSFDLLNYFFARDFTFMVELMKEMLLICEFPQGKSDQIVNYFVVPALLPNPKRPQQTTLKANRIDLSRFESSLDCEIKFNILPVGLFQKLVCSMIDLLLEHRRKAPILHRFFSVIQFSKQTFIFEEVEDEDKIQVACFSQGSEAQELNGFDAIFTILQKINLDHFQSALKFTTDFFKDNDLEKNMLQELAQASEKKTKKLLLENFLKNTQ